MFKMVSFISFITIISVILVNGSLVFTSARFCYTSPTSSCGNGVPIETPFWINVKTSGGECKGFPGFEIKCAGDGTPLINISNTIYSVLHIENVENVDPQHFGTITVRQADINGQGCPQPQQNSSIGSPRFLSLRQHAKMIIFYNCSSPPPNIEAQEIHCLKKYYNNSTKHSYAFQDDQIPIGFNWYRNCEKSAFSYINGYSFDGYSSSNVQALQQGFRLDWYKPIDCSDCEVWGGRCSPNATKGAITCYCPGDLKMIDDVCPYDYTLVTSTARKRVIIGVCTGVGSSVLIFILFLVVYRNKFRPFHNLVVSYWRKNIKQQTNVEVFLENYGCLALQRYKYSAIKKMTNSFKETLGQGGYGSVFKGKLRDNRLVAVKLLNEAKGRGEDFINEVATIGRTNHVNVVSLLGFCTEKNKRALVYEYMPNGSLERFIYTEKNSSTSSPLGQENLYEITLGIVRGLEYLHRGCNTRILHLDIKPHNILLDQNFCPKISDFGLAKLCPTRESLVSMLGARGTIGYIAPEVYCRNFGGVSHKSDVYSYGMMVLEMIGGRKNIDATVENLSEIYFPQWLYTRLERHNTIEGIEHTNIEVSDELFKDETIKKMIIVALWCIQPHPGDRPSTSKVVDMLEGNLDELQMPPNPFPDPSSIS